MPKDTSLVQETFKCVAYVCMYVQSQEFKMYLWVSNSLCMYPMYKNYKRFPNAQRHNTDTGRRQGTCVYTVNTGI